MARYAFKKLLRAYNEAVKPEKRITTKLGYSALKEEAMHRLYATGCREYEISKFDTKSGNPELVNF